MSSFIITKLDGTTFDLYDKNIPSTIVSGSQNCKLLSEDTLTVQTKSARPLPLSIGDRGTLYGKKYKINTQPSVTKQGPRKFITDIIFEGIQYELLDAQYLLPDNTIGDSFTGNLYDFMNILIGNANRVGTWTLGDCPGETEYKTLTFSSENCLSVLQRLCEEYSQEFEIEQSGGTNILHIRTAGVDFPYTFKYGSAGGLYELARKNISSENVVTRLYAYGGSKNLGNGYLSARGCVKLCLPGKNKNSSFIQDTGAINNYGLRENTKAFEDIFPNRYGTVTALGEDYLSFIDSTMFDLNEKDANGTDTKWLIAGVAAKIHFNTGRLAGYEFEVESYSHATKEFKLIEFEDEAGMKFPDKDSAAFQLRTGDEYFIIDIRLPQAYIDEAEAKLQTEAELYYAQNSQPRVQYELNIHDIFLKQFSATPTIANLFAVGDYIPVKDTDIGVDKSIRITGFTRDILKPYKYTITLGEAILKSTITRLIKDQKSIEEIIKFNNLNDPSRARRNWRASQEVLSMVFDPEGDYYSEKIKPLSVETTMLQVGAKSMQFVLSNVVFEPNYQGDPNVIKVGGGQLIHYTIEDTIRTWDIASATFSNLESDTAYYIYARCSKSGNAGNIIIDTTQRKVNHEDGYYTFMIGVLNSVETDDDGGRPARNVSLTYGSTTINGRFLKTGRIESSGGSGSFFDLDNNQFQIGNQNQGLFWNINNNGQLLLKGTFVQSQSGITQPLGCFRGAYNSSYIYYKGDEVTYGGSMYRYISDTPAYGVLPTVQSYWTVIAASGANGANGSDGTNGTNGTNGSDGAYFEYRYAKNGSTTAPPTLSTTTAIPSGWTTTMPSVGTLEYLWMTVAKKSASGALIQNWSTPVRTSGVTGPKGDKGDTGSTGDTGSKGDTGPGVVFRGVYSSSATYYGTSKRVDVVKYNSTYYVARTDAGDGFYGQTPTNTSYWNTFGAQFDSVATNLLLAELANIADWIIKNGKITSQNTTNDGTPRAQLDGQNGGMTLASDISTWTETAGTQNIKQTININSQIAQIEARTSNNDSSYMNSQGIYANRAGINALPSEIGASLMGAIVGIGNGKMDKSYFGSNWGMAGVVGLVLNSSNNPAPSYGGYFQNLMAVGLNLWTKRLSSSYTVTESDCYLSCYNSSNITIYFREPQSVGKIYYIRLNNSSQVTLNTNAYGGKQIMNLNGAISDSYTAGQRGELVMMIWDGQYWLFSTSNQ